MPPVHKSHFATASTTSKRIPANDNDTRTKVAVNQNITWQSVKRGSKESRITQPCPCEYIYIVLKSSGEKL